MVSTLLYSAQNGSNVNDEEYTNRHMAQSNGNDHHDTANGDSGVSSYTTNSDRANQRNGHKSDGFSQNEAASTYPSRDLVSDMAPDCLEPIAIIGLSFKFPGSATDSEAFWRMLTSRECATREIPADRADIKSVYNADSSRSGFTNVTGGNFLTENLETFDTSFFSISPAEAVSIDPQHRKLLETAYRALENAGISLEAVHGSDTGVYTGSFDDDYKGRMWRDSEAAPRQSATGGTLTMLAARLSWFFDLHGPCMNIDTACSSSMIALDSACSALRNRDCSMALVGGSNTTSGLDAWFALSNMSMVGKDGRSFSFDSRANGYARGEGFGMLVLKPVSAAIRDGDTIRAVIRSSGANQDGRTPGITQPSSDAQENLIRATYRKAGLSLATTRFVEAHGTGTSLGDHLESTAINNTFGDHRTDKEPIMIGAVKSNIGHLEGASAIAGLIKAILALEKGIIPPNTNFEEPSARLPKSSRIRFPTKAIPWPVSGLRRASINSFGFGGSNSHAILDDAYHFLRERGLEANHNTVPQPPSSDLDHADKSRLALSPVSAFGGPHILAFSSFDKAGVARQAEAYADHWQAQHDLNAQANQQYMSDLVHTLCARRTQFKWNSFAVVTKWQDLSEIQTLLSPPLECGAHRGLLCVFTGQGAQYAQMGTQLQSYLVFRQTLEKCSSVLQDLGCTWNLFKEFAKAGTDSRVNAAEISQTLCTALQLSLVELLKSLNVVPDVVLGHSSGEIAAAYSAGGLSLSDAMKVAYFRGLTSSKLSQSDTPGAMLAVGGNEDQIESLLTAYPDLTIACYNSSSSFTISGNKSSIEGLAEQLNAKGIFNRQLKVDVAYHSHHMLEVADDYRASLDGLRLPESTKRPLMISSVTLDEVEPETLNQPQYWIDNLTRPVKFNQAIQRLKVLRPTLVDRMSCVLEVGPHGALGGPIRDSLRSLGLTNLKYASVLDRKQAADVAFFQALGTLHCYGVPVDLEVLSWGQTGWLPKRPKVLQNLPEYSFDHSRVYSFTGRIDRNHRFRPHQYHPLLGSPVVDWNPKEPRWRLFIRADENPWVKDHRINGSIVYPASGSLAMVLEAVTKLAPKPIKSYNFDTAQFLRAIMVPDTASGIEIELFLRPVTSERSFSETREFIIYSYQQEEWVENTRGTVTVEFVSDNHDVSKDGKQTQLQQAKHDWTFEAVDQLRMYNFLDKHIEVSYGPSFRRLDHIVVRNQTDATALLAKLEPSQVGFTDECVVHPAILDATVQLLYVVLSRGGKKGIPTTVPTSLKDLYIDGQSTQFLSTADPLQVSLSSCWQGTRGSKSSLAVRETAGDNIIISMEQLLTTNLSVTAAIPVETPESRSICWGVEWKPDISLISVDQITNYCQREWADPEAVRQFWTDLRTYVLFHMRLTRTQLRSDTVRSSHIEKYIKWMDWQLDLPRNVEHPLTEDEHQIDALERVVGARETGEFFVRLCRNLPTILNGEVDPLQVMFSDSLVDNFYRDYFQSTSCSSHIGRYIDILSHKTPDMRVLEIGGGTGGLTEHILRPLTSNGQQRYGSYTFTDISRSFFERVKEKWQSQSERMDFRALDIGKDPIIQGIQPGSYDLIIAGSVLHATPDLQITMSNVRKLLRPGGTLIMLEFVQPEGLFASATFGLLTGWWLSVEEERQWSPCVSTAYWNDVLQQTGFSGVDIELLDHQNEKFHETSILISTAIDAEKKLESPAYRVLLDPSSQHQQTMANLIEAKIFPVQCQQVSLKDFLDGPHNPEACVISLLELDKNILVDIEPELFSEVKATVLKCSDLVWIVTASGNSSQSPDQEMAVGLARTLQSEKPSCKFRSLVLRDTNTGLEQAAGDTVKIATCSATPEDPELEYRIRDGMLCIARFEPLRDFNQQLTKQLPNASRDITLQEYGQCTDALCLVQGDPTDSEKYYFVGEPAAQKPLLPSEVEIEVRFTNLSPLDASVSTRQSPQHFGTLYCGKVIRIGDNVTKFAVGCTVIACGSGSIHNRVRLDQAFAIAAPSDAVLNENLSSVFSELLATYALREIVHVSSEESVLLLAESNAIGQGAISVVRDIGADLFIAVTHDSQKEHFIGELSVPSERVFTINDKEFPSKIKSMAHNQGVDVLLNLLPVSHLGNAMKCVADYGHSINCSALFISEQQHMPASLYDSSISYHNVNLNDLARQRPQKILKSVNSILDRLGSASEDSSRTTLLPLSEGLSALAKIERSPSSDIKILEFDKSSLVPIGVKPGMQEIFKEDGTYIIAGGLGGLGRSIARWFVDHGVRNLVLLSRTGPRNAAHSELLEELRAKNARVLTPAADIVGRERLAETFAQTLASLPPVRGVIQSSMVLEDSIFENMTCEAWLKATRPKVHGTWNLYQLLPKDLDFFIILSSVAGVIGSPGQANYAAANTYQDALAAHIQSQGHKAISLNLGWMESEGYIAENEKVQQNMRRARYLQPVTQDELFASLTHFCNPDLPLSELIARPHVVFGLNLPDRIRKNGYDVPEFMSSAIWRIVRAQTASRGTSLGGQSAAIGSTPDSAGPQEAAKILTASTSKEDAYEKVAGLLILKLCRVLDVAQDAIDMNKPLYEAGVDSLVAVEIKNWVSTILLAEISVFELLEPEPVLHISRLLASRSQHCSSFFSTDAAQ